MNKLGIQWQRETNAVLQYNRLVLPKVLKSVNGRGREFWQQLVGDNPDSIRIYRHYPNYDEWRDEPEQCAQNAVYTIMTKIAHIRDLITHIEDNNEWVFPFFSDTEIDAADRYMETFIKIAWNSFGIRTVFLNSACGHWGDDIVIFHRTLKAAEQYGAILGQHEYDYPTMDRIFKESGDYWLCGKWKKSMAAIKTAGYEGIKCIITETGIDGGVADKPMKGWRSVSNALENYCASLLWYNDLLIADDDVLGTAIFIMSGEGMWSDFDIESSEVPNRISQFPTVPIPEPPEPPNNGDESMIKVYDFNNSPFDPGATVRDMAYLRSIFGDVQVHSIRDRINPQPGDIIYEVEWFDCRVGDVAIMVHIEDENGNGAQGVVGVLGWPDAEPHNLPRTWDLWTNNGAVGVPSDANGDAGLGGYGEGAYYGPPEERGPHFIWLYSLPSDMVDGLGMLTWAPGIEGNHLHANVGYRAVVVGEEPDPEPPPPPPGDTSEIIKALRDTADEIMIKSTEWAATLRLCADGLVEADQIAERLADLL